MREAWIKVVEVYNYNPDGWYVLGVCIVATLVLGWLWPSRDESWLNANPKRRGKMLRKKRREFIEQQAIDDFINALEERTYQGAYSKDEKVELLRKFKQAFPRVRDLYPSPELLKEAIRRRKEAGIHKPVPLPGALPELGGKPRHMFDAAFSKVKTVTA